MNIHCLENLHGCSRTYLVLSKQLEMMLYEQVDCLANNPEVCRFVSSKHIDRLCTAKVMHSGAEQ
jgi:hypothetical protein